MLAFVAQLCRLGNRMHGAIPVLGASVLSMFLMCMVPWLLTWACLLLRQTFVKGSSEVRLSILVLYVATE